MPKIFDKNQARFSFGFMIVRMCRVSYNSFLRIVKRESDFIWKYLFPFTGLLQFFDLAFG